jgi:uncharacterized protein YlzI (FlbEa/FlbD family)
VRQALSWPTVEAREGAMLVHFTRQNGDKLFINPENVWALIPNSEPDETIVKSAAGETIIVKGSVDEVARNLNQFS